MATNPIFTQNYEEDFILEFVFPNGERPDYPWIIIFRTRERPCVSDSSARFVASFDGKVYTHSYPVAETPDRVVIVFEKHGLPPGELRFKLVRQTPNDLFPDGEQKKILPMPTGWLLHDGPTDGVTPPATTVVLERMLRGTPGATPVKGVDYFTPEDIAGIADEAAAQVPVPDVAGPIAEHDTSGAAHADIRELLCGAVGLPVFDPATYALTFTAQSGATVVVDLPIESMGLDYDPEAKEMIYTAADGSKRRIALTEFVDIYVGSVGDEIQITVGAGNEIRAKLLMGSVAMEYLTASLQAVIGGKVDAVAGKGLSTNDYTDADRAEVAKIKDKESAQIVESVSGSSVTLDVLGGHTYLCGELASLSFGAIEDSARESVIFFRSGARATTVAWPEQLKVVGYKVPAANKSYEVSIRRGLAVIVWSE